MIGTSAIGLAIREKKPHQVVGKEHYWSKLHDMTCSAAPIFDPQKRVFGVVYARGKVKLHSTQYDLKEANQVLDMLDAGKINGRAVLVPA